VARFVQNLNQEHVGLFPQPRVGKRGESSGRAGSTGSPKKRSDDRGPGKEKGGPLLDSSSGKGNKKATRRRTYRGREFGKGSKMIREWWGEKGRSKPIIV